ncbi:MAG: penicillin-binding protein 2 [Acidimicrobiaceae bacterium]|nr:penicillin-binding protein 2 [Acidimicrobiaceae bacterium]
MQLDDSKLKDSQNLRLRIVGLVVLCLLAALFSRLWYLQILETKKFQTKASSNVLRIMHEEAPRGRIFDAKGRILVDNEVAYSVMVDRNDFSEKLNENEQQEVIVRLAQILSLSGHLTKAAEISTRLSSHDFGPFDKVPVAIDINLDLLSYLGERSANFPGVSVEERTIRTYPYGNLAAHVLGYVGSINQQEYNTKNALTDPKDADAKVYRISDEIGKSGVERTFEDDLRGIPGQRVVEVNAFNEMVLEHQQLYREPVPGNDIHLTIDIDLQQLLERQLQHGLATAKTQSIPETGEEQPVTPGFRAPAGAGVVLDPRNGSVLAMASFPTYDPAEFVSGISQAFFDELTTVDNYSPILNRAIQGEYPPGSTFKSITTYAALTQGIIGSNTNALIDVDEFYSDTGTYKYPFCSVESDTCIFDSPYCCERGVDLRDAIAVSSDTYFYRLAGEGFFHLERPDDEGIQAAAKLFGFGSKSGIPLPFERSGVVPDREYYDRLYSQGVFQRDGSQWYAGDTINLAIGQGTLLATPLQIANSYAVLANGGKLYQPNIVSKITDRNGRVVKDFGARLVDDIDMPSFVITPLLDGLNATTAYNLPSTFEDNRSLLTGTAYKAFNQSGTGGVDFPLTKWPVAGKTGTAEKKDKADSAWFVGFGPSSWPEQGIFNMPEVVATLLLEEAGFGGDIAAPAIARLLLAVATDTVTPALTDQEMDVCYAEVRALTMFLEGVRVGTIKVDENGQPLTTQRPELSDLCSDLVGGEQVVEQRGLNALIVS